MKLISFAATGLLMSTTLVAQSGNTIIKDDTEEIVIFATDSDRTFSISIRDNSADSVVKVKIYNADDTLDQFTTLEGTGDGTGVLKLKPGQYVKVEDVDSPQNTDDAKISYDVN